MSVAINQVCHFHQQFVILFLLKVDDTGNISKTWGHIRSCVKGARMLIQFKRKTKSSIVIVTSEQNNNREFNCNNCELILLHKTFELKYPIKERLNDKSMTCSNFINIIKSNEGNKVSISLSLSVIILPTLMTSWMKTFIDSIVKWPEHKGRKYSWSMIIFWDNSNNKDCSVCKGTRISATLKQRNFNRSWTLSKSKVIVLLRSIIKTLTSTHSNPRLKLYLKQLSKTDSGISASKQNSKIREFLLWLKDLDLWVTLTSNDKDQPN
jgi:hypothetical protein